MIQTRPDWCISRQRVWGVPIAVFLCEGCGKPLNDQAINGKVVELLQGRARTRGLHGGGRRVLPAGTKCPHCGGAKFKKETDIFDVWLESGASYLALAGMTNSYPWPSDLYLEGRRSVSRVVSVFPALRDGHARQPPYKTVVAPGWTLDEKGQAMSNRGATTLIR